MSLNWTNTVLLIFRLRVVNKRFRLSVINDQLNFKILVRASNQNYIENRNSLKTELSM